MRAVVQRVKWARVRVEGEVVGEIARGVLVYVGVGKEDQSADADELARKVSGLRIYADGGRAMNRSLSEEGGEALVVSQFTLYGDCRKGRRPSFNGAMGPEGAEELVERVRGALAGAGHRTAAGRFGASMEVESLNDGPVTILIDTKKEF